MRFLTFKTRAKARDINPSHRMMNDRGSITIIALMIAIIFGFVTNSFLNSSLTELKIAKSNSNSKKVVNVTQAGAEIAIRALNENDFTGWTPSGPWSIKSLYNLDMGDGDTATMYLYVLDQAPNPIRIYSIVYLYLSNGEMVPKYFYADLRQRSQFPNGITTFDDIIFDSNVDSLVKIDSYESSQGDYDFLFNRNDNGTLVGREIKTWLAASAEIYGYVSTRWSPPTVGGSGKIYGVSSPPGADVDSSRIADGFEPSFPIVTAPAGVTDIYTFDDEDDDYLPKPFEPRERLITTDLIITNDQTLTINEDMTLVVKGAVLIEGILKIADGKKLKLYVEKAFEIKGHGRIENYSGAPGNLGDPKNLIIYSTGNSDFKIGKGSAAFYGAIYTPGGKVELNKDGEMFGAIIAREVLFKGAYDFHFDEDLKSIVGDEPTYTADFSRNY